MRSLHCLEVSAAVLLLAGSASAINFSDDGRWKASSGTGSTSPNRGDPISLTWSLPPDGTYLNDYIPGDHNTLHADFAKSAGANYLDMFPYIFNRIGAVSGLQLTQCSDDGVASETDGAPGLRGDIRVVASNMTAYYAPWFSYTGGGWAGMPPNGNIHINTDQPYGYVDKLKIIMHEAGHAVGFGHQQIYESATATDEFRTGDPDTVAIWGNYGSITGFMNRYGPQFDDVYALHRMYGDKWERNGGNDTPATAEDLGNVSNAGKSIGTQINGLTLAYTDSDFRSIDGTSDTDCFRVALSGNSNITVTLTPKGPTYYYSPDNGVRYLFETSKQSDLWFDVLDGSGQILSHVNAAGLGAPELFTGVLGAGNYVIRVAGTEDRNQFYRLDLAGVSVPEPASTGLATLGALAVLARRRAR